MCVLVTLLRASLPTGQVHRFARARRRPVASLISSRVEDRDGQMPPRSRGHAGKTKDASSPAPKPAPPPIFLPLPPHPVDRWSREDARAEPVEQLLYGPVHTRRPTLVRAPLGPEAEAALGAEAGSQLFGDGTDMAAAYKAVAYGLRDGWESCPPQVSSRLAVDLPRWLAPRVAGDLLCRVPALAATQHGQARRPGSGRAAGHLRLEAPSRSRTAAWDSREELLPLGPRSAAPQ